MSNDVNTAVSNIQGNDPYAAPTASLENTIDAPPIPTSIWTAKGRLGVLTYLAQSFLLLLAVMIIAGAAYAIIAVFQGGIPQSIEDFYFLPTPALIILSLIAVLIYLVFSYITICLLIKRLHDRNHAGWWGAALFIGMAIPLVNLVAWPAYLYAVFWPGQKTGNRYGGQRTTKGWEKVVGIIGVAVSIVIFAASVYFLAGIATYF